MSGCKWGVCLWRMPPPPIVPAREDTPPRIRLTSTAPTLGPMSVDRSFLTLGLDIAEQALRDVIARDNLHLRPEKMPRRRRARANFRPDRRMCPIPEALEQ